MANALKKISARAKQLQKKHPAAKWTNLIKQASAEYRSGTKSKPAPKKKKSMGGLFSRKRTSGYAFQKDISRKLNNGMTISAAKHFLIKEYEDILGKESIKLFNAKTRKEKKDLRTHISELKTAINKVKGL